MCTEQGHGGVCTRYLINIQFYWIIYYKFNKHNHGPDFYTKFAVVLLHLTIRLYRAQLLEISSLQCDLIALDLPQDYLAKNWFKHFFEIDKIFNMLL